VKYSVCKIDNTKLMGYNTVYDERMGVLSGDTQECVTCERSAEDCPGHYGHIELNIPVIHPLYVKQVVSFLKCVCIYCYRLMVMEEHIGLWGLERTTGMVRFNRLLAQIKTQEICCHCSEKQPAIEVTTEGQIMAVINEKGSAKVETELGAEEVLRIFNSVSDEDVQRMGIDAREMHPRNLVLRVLPVIPTCARPHVVVDSNPCDDDITNHYTDIVKLNNSLAEQLPEAKYKKAVDSLHFKISTLMDNSKGKARHTTTNKPMQGLGDRLSGKSGLLRGYLLGKRTAQSGRTVIGPEPNLRVGELGVPPEMAEILTVPVRINRYNIEEMTRVVNEGKATLLINGKGEKKFLKYLVYRKGTELLYGDIIQRAGQQIVVTSRGVEPQEGDVVVRNGEILEDIRFPKRGRVELKIGEVVHRHLKDGDALLLNRQPTLHRGSMIAHTCKIIPGKTLRFNLPITPSLNADFDGKDK